MIRLIHDDVSISVDENNPLYKTLKRFSGESFLVYTQSSIKINKEKPEKKDTPKQSFSREAIFREFDEIFLNKDDTDTENKINPAYVSILRSHLDSILGGETGDVYFDVEKEGVYRRNDKYLIRNIPQASH
jgi:hypothetical protein